ncbi:hypothetical protein QPL30_23535 [Escherichia coli]|nr:hypothetical protein [Escherichia coli]MDS1619942.1 hypothetical protein [Escherichia coli]
MSHPESFDGASPPVEQLRKGERPQVSERPVKDKRDIGDHIFNVIERHRHGVVLPVAGRDYRAKKLTT